MFLRVLMNINQYVKELVIGSDLLSLVPAFKKASRSFISFVDRLYIRAQKNPEFPGNYLFATLITPFIIIDSQQQMEVIGQ